MNEDRDRFGRAKGGAFGGAGDYRGGAGESGWWAMVGHHVVVGIQCECICAVGHGIIMAIESETPAPNTDNARHRRLFCFFVGSFLLPSFARGKS